MKPLRLIIAILSTLILSVSQVQAASSGIMHVSATIRPWVVFNGVQHIYSYSVTSADLQRGYVDLPGSITLDIKTNLNKEVTVNIDSENGERILFKESTAGSFSESKYTLNPVSHRPGELITRKIDSRVMLAKNMKEGVYALNVSMSPEI